MISRHLKDECKIFICGVCTDELKGGACLYWFNAGKRIEKETEIRRRMINVR